MGKLRRLAELIRWLRLFFIMTERERACYMSLIMLAHKHKQA